MTRNDKLNFALPDGHMMVHVLPFIEGAGIVFKGYETEHNNRQPILKLLTDSARLIIKKPEQVASKIIRPQDMPVHVANGNFDIAITGTDWIDEHLKCFPDSPLKMAEDKEDNKHILRLGFGKVRIVAAVQEEKEDNLSAFVQSFDGEYIRIASEYVYLADTYAQQKKMYPYRVIMTYGATESLIPEDCDIIIENTETGNTLTQNKLKILDTLKVLGADKSEGCLIANPESMKNATKNEMIEGIFTLFNNYLQSEGIS